MWFKQEHHNHKSTYPVQVLTKNTRSGGRNEGPLSVPMFESLLPRGWTVWEGLEKVCHWRRVLRIQRTRAIPNVLSLPDGWGCKLLVGPLFSSSESFTLLIEGLGGEYFTLFYIHNFQSSATWVLGLQVYIIYTTVSIQTIFFKFFWPTWWVACQLVIEWDPN